jgi:hypothetical protein
VNPGAELERVAAGLPRLALLTLPGEWAVGWAAPAPPEAGRRPGLRPRDALGSPATGRQPGPPPGPGPGAGPPNLAAAPLARLLLACRGRAGAPAVRVALPSFRARRAVVAVVERIVSICAAVEQAAAMGARDAGEGICAAASEAAGGRAGGAGEGEVQAEGAGLPRVEILASGRNGSSWPGWREGGDGSD